MSGKARLLVVEDMNYWYRTLKETVYVHGGYEIDWAEDRDQCMELVRQRHYDIVLVDIELEQGKEDRSGYVIVEELIDRFVGEKQNTAVAVWSHLGRNEHEKLSYKRGAINFVPKYSDPARLPEWRKMVSDRLDAILSLVKLGEAGPLPSDIGVTSAKGPFEIGKNRRGKDCVYMDGEELALSDKEFVILSELVQRLEPIPTASLVTLAGVKNSGTLRVTIDRLKKKLKSNGKLLCHRTGEGYVISRPKCKPAASS